jgi:60 kDa SS-A/Ro ribonucleoprotein
MSYLNSVLNPAQSQPIVGKDMVKNNAGGYVFQIDKWSQLKRFLVLGTEGGTYYVDQQKLSVETAKNTIECIKEDGLRVLELIKNTKTIKEDTRIFALALCASYGNQTTKEATYASIKEICYIPTLLFMFCDFVVKMRGWSAGLRKGVGRYYTETNSEKLAMHVVKYQNRNNWKHCDVLNLTHPKSSDESINAIFEYIIDHKISEKTPGIISVVEYINKAKPKVDELVALTQIHNLPREVIPTEYLTEKKIWEALLPSMPYMALVRNLGNLSKNDVLTSNLSAETKLAYAKIVDLSQIEKNRINPMFLLNAYYTYASGHSFKGKGTWKPVPCILQALLKAFYSSFQYVEALNKNIYIGLDVSGSMTSNMAGKNISTAAAASALALTFVKKEPFVEVMGFDNNLRRIPLTENDDIKLLGIKLIQDLSDQLIVLYLC